MNALNQLLTTLKIEANIYQNGQYCGLWAIDTSGTQKMTFHIISKGRCYLLIDDEILEMNTGDVIFFPNDASHKISNVTHKNIPINVAKTEKMSTTLNEESTGLVCGNFENNHPLFPNLLKQLPKYIHIQATQNTPSKKIIDLICEESHQIDESSSLLLNRLADCLFYTLLRDHTNAKSGLFSAFAHPQLSKSLEFIYKNIDKNFTLEELANEAGMSRSAFANTFKEMINQTPMEYVTQWRMTQAYRWLADEGISTLAAALRSGYDNEASFSKAFKRIIGFGPGKARSMYKKL